MRDARSWIVVLGVVTAIAAATWTFAMPGADPAAIGRDDAATDATPSAAAAASERSEERSATPESDAASTASAAASEALPNDRTLLVEVTDIGGRPVPGARVWLAHGEERWSGFAPASGVVTFAWSSAIDDLDAWRVMAVIPGRLVARPLLPFLRPNVVAISLGDVGTVRITCPGAVDIATVNVLGEASDGFHGGMSTCTVVVGETVDLRFAAGRFDVRATATIGDLNATANVPGPRSQGEVVDVVLNLASCRVSGTFARPASDAKNVHAICIGPDGAESHQAIVDADDRTFSVDLPRRTFESVCLVCRDEFVALPRTSFDVAEIDVGTLDLRPRPSLGRLEVRDAEGNVEIGCGRVVTFTTVTGRRSTMPECALWPREVLGRGIEWFGLPAIASIVVEPNATGFYATPSSIEVRDGGVFRATLAVGGRVVVRATGTDGSPRWQFRLRETATNRRFEFVRPDWADEIFGGVFEGLPPGDYVVESEKEVAAGPPIRVLAGSEQRVDVVLTTK